MAFGKACSLEAPTTEAEVDELIDFTFAELNRGVESAGFSTSQRASGRQLRLPSSLLEGDAIDPYHDREGRQPREAAKRRYGGWQPPKGAQSAADSKVTTTAVHSRRRGPLSSLVTGETVFIHRQKNGAQGWRGPGVCVLSEDPKPGRNETVWVHMQECLHKCNRTQVRPATKEEEAEGIEAIASMLSGLTAAIR